MSPEMDDPRLAGIAALLALMDTLRSPDGCPWDRAQTGRSLRPFLLEETYETLEALDEGDSDHLREELGDLLFQVVFHSRIHEEAGGFDFGAVAQGITDKLVGRHPHVFGDERGKTAIDAWRDWELLKKKERGGRGSVLDGVPKSLPSLARSQRTQDKAARVGFDWKSWDGPAAKVEEELAEFKAEIPGADRGRLEAELGDLLFSVVALGRHLELNAEDALRTATDRFEGRFRHMEASGQELNELDEEGLEALWEKAKAEELRQARAREAGES